MKIGVLGTGMVGKAIATRLAELGHEVRMGSRQAGSAQGWASETAGQTSHGSFADAAGWGEVLFNCTAGAHSLEALAMAGEQRLEGKVLADVSNPLDFGRGAARLDPVNDDSLGERIQRAYPGTRVVKTLNTVNAGLMVDPGRVGGDHIVFVCGDDSGAKSQVRSLLTEFGWTPERVIDLGGIGASRGTEMYLMLWLAVMESVGTVDFNITLAR